jgi:quercetin dioxygenase-like cupin family protein
MAHVGETIEHPLTGERLTFLETAGSTGGKFLRARLDLRPGGAIPNVHVHPGSEERFAVVEGRLQVRRAKQAWVAEAGETVIVPPGTAHVWGNPFDEPAAVIADFRPALRAETFFETFFGLARDGKVDPKRNLPKSLLQTALMFHDYRAEIQLPGIVGVGVRGVSAVLAPLARARGYRSRYPQYSAPDAP